MAKKYYYYPLCCYCDCAVDNPAKPKRIGCMYGLRTFCEKYKEDCEKCGPDKNKKCLGWVPP